MIGISTLLLYIDELFDEALYLLNFIEEVILELSKFEDFILAFFMSCLDCLDFTPCKGFFQSICLFNCYFFLKSSYSFDFKYYFFYWNYFLSCKDFLNCIELFDCIEFLDKIELFDCIDIFDLIDCQDLMDCFDSLYFSD